MAPKGGLAQRTKGINVIFHCLTDVIRWGKWNLHSFNTQLTPDQLLRVYQSWSNFNILLLASLDDKLGRLKAEETSVAFGRGKRNLAVDLRIVVNDKDRMFKC